MTQRTILVVSPARDDRDRLGGWLEAHEVLTCPGPSGPEACLGLRGVRCPLAGAADVVVLDMGSWERPLGGSVSGWELLNAYRDLGLPVVVLGEPGDLLIADGAATLTALPRTATEDDIHGAVDHALAAIG